MRLFGLLAVVALASSQWPIGQAAAAPATAATTVIERDIEYQPGLALDLYGRSGTPRPLAVCLHGGGWVGGDKSMCARAAPLLTASGFVMATVDYGRAPGMSIERSAAAIARAVAFLQSDPHRFGIDPSRVVLVGHSAGAFYAALVALDWSYLAQAGVKESTIRGVALLDCVACDLPVEMKRPRGLKRSAIFGTDPAHWAAISPDAHARSGAPPFWMAYSSGPGASQADALLFARTLETKGVRVDAEGFAGVTHGQFLSRLGEPGFAVADSLAAFLKSVGK